MNLPWALTFGLGVNGGSVVIGVLLFFLLFDPGEPDARALALPLPLEVVSDGPGDQYKAPLKL